MAHHMTDITTIISDWQNISTDSSNGNEEWEWAPVAWEWWEVVQLILAIIGILGNLLVMLVIFWPGRRRCATDTLIGVLAVADFLTSISIIPHPKVTFYPDTTAAQVYCKIIHIPIYMWTSICASIFTLTTISVERLMAVRFPFRFQRLFSPMHTSIAVILIWVGAFVLNSGGPYSLSVINGQCVPYLPVGIQRFLGVAGFLLEYVLPIIVMVTAHSWTIYTLRQRPFTALRKAQIHVLQMLLIVVITFIVCWTPNQFEFLLFNLGVVDYTHLFSPLYRCFIILAFANSCVNPFIYAAKMPSFSKALRDLVRREDLRHGLEIHSVFGL